MTDVWLVFISYIKNTSEYRQYCHVGKTAQHCRLGSFQVSDFAGDLDDSKSTSGRYSMYLPESNGRTHTLDVQERKFSSTRFY